MTGKSALKTGQTVAQNRREALETEYLLMILAELRRANFLLEQMSGVEAPVEAFNGRD